ACPTRRGRIQTDAGDPGIPAQAHRRHRREVEPIHAALPRRRTPPTRSQPPLPCRHDDPPQLEATGRHWGRRLSEIETELETEPARVRDVYQVRARRIEPVGLIYLWPVTN